MGDDDMSTTNRRQKGLHWISIKRYRVDQYVTDDSGQADLPIKKFSGGTFDFEGVAMLIRTSQTDHAPFLAFHIPNAQCCIAGSCEYTIWITPGICPGWRQRCTDCLLYTSDAADEEDSVDLGGRRIIK